MSALKSTSFVVGLILLLASAGFAQERVPGVPIPRGKDGVRMKPPPPRETKRHTGEPAAADEPAVPEDPFDAAVAALAGWPDTESREAAANLALYGPEGEPLLIDALKTAEAGTAAGLCFVLGEIGGDAALAAIQAVAARPTMAEHLKVVFDALGKLDSSSATRRILPFLRHPKRSARNAAESWLSDHMDPSMRGRLAALLRDGSRGARLSSLRLLERLDPEYAGQTAFGLLGDSAPEVARAAVDIVAGRSDDATIARLNRMVTGREKRPSAYSLLALALIHVQDGELPYDRALIPHLLGGLGLRSNEKLARGAAPIALADIGYAWEIPEVDAVLDDEVVSVLLDTLGGPSYFIDFGSFAEAARDRFGRLTGIQDRRPVPALWKWWKEHRKGFTARRALRSIDADDPGEFRVRAVSSMEPALPTTLFSTVTKDAVGPDTLGIGFVYLLPKEASDLITLMTRHLLPLPDSGVVNPGLFPGAGGPGGRGMGPSIIITVSVSKRSRTLVGRRGAVPDGVLVVLKRLRELREFYSWQRYWDRQAYPRYDDFIAAQAEFFAGNPGPEQRMERMKSIVISSLDDLVTDTERTAAVELLVGLAPAVNDTDAYNLAIQLEASPAVNPFVERVIEVLIAAKKPLVLPILASWFENQPGERPRALFVAALASFGASELSRAANSDRVYLRRASMRAAGDVLTGSELVTVLMKGVADKSPAVRQSALRAFGRSGLAEAMPVLKAGLMDPDPEVTYAAIEALGLLGREECVPLLSIELMSDDKARQVAAVRALCATGLRSALMPIIGILRNEESQLLRGVAAREIVKFGEKALGGLSALSMDPSMGPEVRSLAIESLVRIGGDNVAAILEALLGDQEASVADAAAYALAARARKVAAPRLLDALEKERNPVRTIAALELLSCQSFPTARAEELPAIYRGWWSEHESEPASAWFASALQSREYDDPVLGRLASGQPPMDLVPVLTRALADGDWFIRANANLWLRRITLEEFGEITRFSTPVEIRAVQARWRVWWEDR